MRVVMLGHTRAGKTTYMATLYGLLQEEFNEITLRAETDDTHNDLVRLADLIRQGVYPDLTNQRASYNFYLRYRQEAPILFSWADYRGGAIDEGLNSSDATQLLEELRNAKGLMLFCDANALLSGNVYSVKLGRLIHLLGIALENVSSPISIAIVFTKFDMVASPSDKLLKPFEGLIHAAQVNHQIEAAFIPVACGSRNINVGLPLLFALRHAIAHSALSERKELNQYTEKRESWEKMSEEPAPVRRFFEWLLDFPTDEELADRYRQSEKESKRKYDSFHQLEVAISKYVKQLPIIKQGRTIADYSQALARIAGGAKLNGHLQSTNPFEW